MDFKEQIKHPNWQKRRLEILQKDNFACQMCGDKESPLHVHHLRYVKGLKYWEYKDWELITLCEECHSFEHLAKDEITGEKIKNIRDLGISNTEIVAFLDCIHSLLLGDVKNAPKTIEDIFGRELSAYVENDVHNIIEWRKRLHTSK
jgi:hypothetical protein